MSDTAIGQDEVINIADAVKARGDDQFQGFDAYVRSPELPASKGVDKANIVDKMKDWLGDEEDTDDPDDDDDEEDADVDEAVVEKPSRGRKAEPVAEPDESKEELGTLRDFHKFVTSKPEEALKVLLDVVDEDTKRRLGFSGEGKEEDFDLPEDEMTEPERIAWSNREFLKNGARTVADMRNEVGSLSKVTEYVATSVEAMLGAVMEHVGLSSVPFTDKRFVADVSKFMEEGDTVKDAVAKATKKHIKKSARPTTLGAQSRGHSVAAPEPRRNGESADGAAFRQMMQAKRTAPRR